MLTLKSILYRNHREKQTLSETKMRSAFNVDTIMGIIANGQLIGQLKLFEKPVPLGTRDFQPL
ncbi:hypothetical protein [Desulfobulbus sp.]|uniref:hypothetical protein n=1 Tax=Desulfobulbus sp. TaxID=895 RepID=UPI0027B9377E|nr:hypothetical protein [Desulfobulbus sp.]